MCRYPTACRQDSLKRNSPLRGRSSYGETSERNRFNSKAEEILQNEVCRIFLRVTATDDPGKKPCAFDWVIWVAYASLFRCLHVRWGTPVDNDRFRPKLTGLSPLRQGPAHRSPSSVNRLALRGQLIRQGVREDADQLLWAAQASSIGVALLVPPCV